MNQEQRSILIVACLICGGFCEKVFSDSPVRAGDRIAIIGNTFADQLRVHGYLETMLVGHWPDDPVSIRHLGWGGDMLTARDRPTNFPTEESTLKAHRTDVMIACFGMGESFAGRQGLAEFKADIHSLINSHQGKIYNGKTPVRLILVSPIAYESVGSLTPLVERRNEDLRAYSRAMGEVAADRSIPFIDLNEPSRYLMDEPTCPNLTHNGIHLNDFGYWAISRTFFEGLVSGEDMASGGPWHLFLDAASMTCESRGVTISDLSFDRGQFSFDVREESGPTPRPPIHEKLPPQLTGNRDTLVVANLPGGQYQLTVDGVRVVSASHRQWEQGVPIDASPAHRRVDRLRAAIHDKNLQFTYSWKALNQVHIVGERRSSPSGRALPEEVVAFRRLADQKDEQLRGSVGFKTRKWELTPVER